MEANLFLKELFSKVEAPSEVLEAVNSVSGSLPDSVSEILPKVLTVGSAKANKEVASFFENKINERLTKAQVQRLEAAGFTQDEIKAIRGAKPEDRVLLVAELEREKNNKVLNSSVDERVKEYEARVREYEAKVANYQRMLLEKDSYYANKIEQVRMENDLNAVINSLPIRTDGIPKEAAVRLLKDELRTKLEMMGAQLQFINGHPKLVRADDASLDYYDDGNNLVDAYRFIAGVASGLNLLDKAGAPKVVATPNPPSSVNKAASNHVNKVRELINNIRKK